MKKLLLFCFSLSFVFSVIAQHRTMPNKAMRDYAIPKGQPVHFVTGFDKTPGMPAYKNTNDIQEEIIGETRYDLQTNSAAQNRIHIFEDGTIGAVWTLGFSETNFPGRGTGYNYFNGEEWGEIPNERLESDRTGWPSYSNYGENGEIILSHIWGGTSGQEGLFYSIREEKGTGEWTENLFQGPVGFEDIAWPRIMTNGLDNSIIHIIAITKPTGNSGAIYEGQDGALLYSRSMDGGNTWDPINLVPEGLNADNYLAIGGDTYDIVAGTDNNIAILAGDSWYDLVLLKSTDNGDNWEKTVIWENPYPLFDPNSPIVTDTFYCPDGSHHLAYDMQGKIHIVFGINRAHSDGTDTYWFPGVGGIGYWNEDMPTFSNDLNALSPYGDAGSELVEDVNLIGWSQDINNNGEIDVLDAWGTYYVGFSSHPQIIIDENNFKYVVFSSVTETYDNGAMSYRHLWARASWGPDVWGNFIDLSGDLIHIFDECVYPFAAKNSDDQFYIIYQQDNEPGVALNDEGHPYGDNNIIFMKVTKDDLIPVGVDEVSAPITRESVSQNMPNPFSGTSWVNVEVHQTCELSLEVTNITGQRVYAIPPKEFKTGSYRLPIHAENLTNGVYFYTIKAGDALVTKKMIVD